MSVRVPRNAQKVEAAGAVTASTRGTNITPHATANTKGSYTELIAATASESEALLVLVHGTGASGSPDYLVDIGIGGSGSEVVLVPNIPFSDFTLRETNNPVLIPLHVPAGSRLSARAQANGASQGAIAVLVYPIAFGSGAAGGYDVATGYGANTADSGGTSIDPGAVAHTKGAYTEITAATTRPLEWLVVFSQNQGNGGRQTYEWLVDIAVGAAASEVVKVPNLLFMSHTGNNNVHPRCYAFPLSVPVGTRLSACAQCSGTDATDRLLDILLLGVG